MERKDLLAKNCAIFKDQGNALDKYAKKSVKVLVVGNPANTNAAIAMLNAPSIARENFSALTRLDHNRAKAQLAKKFGVPPSDVKDVAIWGNHSSTQYPNPNHGYYLTASGFFFIFFYFFFIHFFIHFFYFFNKIKFIF